MLDVQFTAGTWGQESGDESDWILGGTGHMMIFFGVRKQNAAAVSWKVSLPDAGFPESQEKYQSRSETS